MGRHTSGYKGLALVVDDLATNRKLLEALLNLAGYQTISAENGEQAVKMYTEQQPDMVFMDVMMPVMDGYAAAERIKSLAGANFVPIIFLTALSERDALVKCIEAGGDDFLSKPYRQEILNAKIKAMERIQDLSRKVEDQRLKIESQHRQLLNEEIAAEQIYNRAITWGNVNNRYINSLLNSVSIFSGDLLLTAYHPDGSLYVLLGDFTGHGLTAAVGVLPAAEVFRAMTAKGFSALDILTEINAKLHQLLPTGMFMTACFVVIDKNLQSATLWNAGMPEILILGIDTQNSQQSVVKHKVASRYLPLGILEQMDAEPSPAQFEITPGDRILLCTDGVTEAKNAQGVAFGTLRYEQAALSAPHSFQEILNAMEKFCSETPYSDDVSLLEIHLFPGLLQGNSTAV